VIFIRHPDQQIPRVCGSPDCCTIWNECPDAFDLQEKVEGEGFSGLCGDEHIFISRIGERTKKLDSLLAHEFSHWLCHCGHTQERSDLEIAIFVGM
jgi:hypothetical protein